MGYNTDMVNDVPSVARRETLAHLQSAQASLDAAARAVMRWAAEADVVIQDRFAALGGSLAVSDVEDRMGQFGNFDLTSSEKRMEVAKQLGEYVRHLDRWRRIIESYDKPQEGVSNEH